MTHSFSVEEAQKYGLNAAVVLNLIRGWIAYNKAGARNQRDGRTWTYNSVKAWGKLLPYLTGKQIRSAIDELAEAGVIIKGKFNDNAYDHTLWYAIPDEDTACPVGQNDSPAAAMSSAPEGKRLDQENTQRYNPTMSGEESMLQLEEVPALISAETIYAAYPRKVAKSAALAAIGRVLKRGVPAPKLLAAVTLFSEAAATWPEEDKKYIPYPASWFNAGRYDDDPQNWKRNGNSNGKTNGRALGINSNLAAFDEYDRRQMAPAT